MLVTDKVVLRVASQSIGKLSDSRRYNIVKNIGGGDAVLCEFILVYKKKRSSLITLNIDTRYEIFRSRGRNRGCITSDIGVKLLLLGGKVEEFSMNLLPHDLEIRIILATTRYISFLFFGGAVPPRPTTCAVFTVKMNSNNILSFLFLR
ncbi:unnamed protein product [Amoebophrya sp. A25]|nr:unnamed protein product [Amoebophrya sp. A25]|eukprot:GSA25T00019631001.1